MKNQNYRKDALQKRIEQMLESDKDSLSGLSAKTIEEILEEVSAYHQELETQNLELQRVYEELDLSKKHYMELFNDGPIGYLVVDAADTIIKANSTFADMVEKKSEELRGNKINSLIHPTFQDQYYLLVKKVIKEKCKSSILLRFNCEKELYVKLECSLQANNGEENLLMGFLDVTREVINEEQLIESRERYRAVADYAYHWEYWKNSDGNLLYMSPSCERITGYSKHDFFLNSNLIEDIIHPDDKKEFDEHKDFIKNPDQLRVTHQSQFRIKCKNGETKWIGHACQNIYKDDGTHIGLRVTNGDITERKHLERLQQVRLNLLEYATEHSLSELLQKTLDEIEAITESSIGFYHFMSNDENSIILQAWSTKTAQKFCKADGHGLHYSVDKAGVWVDCIRERKPIIHNNYSTLTHKRGMPDGHAEVVREVVVPIFREGKIVAILGVGNKPTDYTNSDIDIVSYLADVAWDITEKKRTEHEQMKLAEELERIFHGNHDAMFLVEVVNTNEFRYIRNNKFHQESTGFKPEDFRNKTPQELVGPEQGKTIEGNYRRCIESAQTITYEEIIELKGDKRIWKTRLTPVFSKERKPYIVGSSEDITQQKRAEERSTLLASMLDYAPSAISVHDLEGNFLYTNYKNLEYHGYTREEFLYLNLHQIDVPESEALIEDRINQIKKFGEASFEVEHYRKDGSRIPLLIYSKRVDWFGKPALLSLGTDITERKSYEINLVESNKRIEFLAETALSFVKINTLNEFYQLLGESIKRLEPEAQVMVNSINLNELSLTIHNVICNEDTLNRVNLLIGYNLIGKQYSVNQLDIKPSDGRITHFFGGLAEFTLGIIPQAIIPEIERILNVDKLYGIAVTSNSELVANVGMLLPKGADIKSIETVEAFIKQASIAYARITAEERVKLSEEKFRRITENMTDVVWIADLNMNTIYVSPSIERLTGFTPEHQINRPASEKHPPETIQLLKQILTEGLENEKNHKSDKDFSRVFEAQQYKADGSIIWVSINASFVRDETGKPIAIQGVTRDITEQKRVSEALRVSEQHFKLSMEATNDGLWDWDIPTDSAYYSPAYYSMLGYGIGEFPSSGNTWIGMVHPDDREITKNLTHSCIEGQTDDFELEYRMRTRNGDWIWILCRGKCVERENNGKAKRVVGTHIDITDRKHYEEELRRKNTFIQTVLDNLPIGVALNTINEGQAMYMNKKFQEIYGWSEEALRDISKFFEKVYPDKNYREELMGRIMADIQSGDTERMRWENIKVTQENGSVRIINAVNIPLFEQNTMVSTVLDVTEQRSAELALQQSEERFKMLFEKAPVGYQSLSEEGNFLEVNETWLSLLGYTKEEVIGKWFGDFLAPEFVEGFRKRFPIFKAEGKIHSEFKMVRKDDSEVFIAFDGRIGYTPQGEFKQTHCTLNDITEQRKAELALKAKTAELEAIYNNSPLMMCILDEHQNVVYANNYLLEFFGKSYEEIINRRACGVFGCINANEHEKGCGYGSKCPSCDLNNAITDTIKTGESLRDVEYNAAIDNQDEIKEISLMAYTSLIRTQKKLVSLIFVDVSERKKMETALRENEERYRKLYEETPVMLHSIDKKGRLISVSNTWLQKLGYTKDEVIGKKSIDFLTEESKHKALEVYLPEFFDKGFSKDASYQMVTKSGEVLDVLMSAVAENADSMGFVRSMAVIEDVTERKKAEQALRESEEMMRSSQSVAQICSYSTNLNEEDISKSVWVCSPEFYKIFGIEETYPHTIEGWANFIHPDYREEVFAYHASVVKEKKSFNREYKIIRINDGEERWVLGTGELVYDDQGKPIRMYGAIQDITERKIAEKALRESEERFRGLYENATIGIYRTTPDGQILMANPALVKMLEYSSFEELARRNLSDEGYEASYARSEFMRLIEENGKVYGLESAWRTKSGKVIYISESARLVSDGNGKLLYYEGTIEDITQRKKAVDALRASEERLSSILRAAPVGIGVVVNRVFTELNQTICNITGYNREELIGQSALMLYHSQEEYETVGREKYRQISEKGTGTVETVWRRKDGSLVNIILSSTPINPVDLSQGVTFTALDISERKKAEEELEQSQLLLQTISDNMFDLVALTDLTGHYSFVGASYSYLGYNPSDLLGINMMFHVHPDDLPEVLQTFKEFSESKVDGTRAEYRFCCSDGSYVWVETVGRYLYDDKGKPKSILLNSRNIDERKKIEEALRLSENQYRLLFENMTQGFALHEIISDENDKPYDYRYLSINPAFEKLTGLKAQDLIGKTILEVMPNTEKYWIDNYGKVAQTREPIRYENYAKELGKYYDVSAFCPQKDFFAVVFSDITERKKAEEKVLKLTKGIDQSPATVVITDIDGNIEFVNPRFTEVTGFTAQEAMGQNPRVLKSDYQTKEFYKDLWDTIKSGNDWRGELCNKKKSGELYWESASISPIKNEFGEIVNFIAVKEDITDRKNAILALEQNNRLINTMLDNLPVGIFMVDALNGKPIIANEYAKKLLGKGIVKDASTETLSEVYQAFKVGTNQFYPTSEMPIVKGIRGIPSHIDDMEVLQPDGRKILLEVFGCPVFNSQGQIWASLVGFLDITERKRTEITLRENQLVLKEKNEEYLALNEELTESNERINRINTDLVLARQKAEESDQLKSAFLANMSHEIRTPMNAIIGFSEMLLNPRIPSEKKDFFAHILNSACHQLLNIVEDIIDISKIETGQMDIHIGKSNINQIVNRIQQIYYPQTSENGVDILAKCQLNDDMAEINTDSTKLSQILTNLVSNAVKFTEKGAIEIGYVVKAEVIEFYVKDSGVGIASEHFELIFERFRQVDLGDTRKYGGTGLGLPICKAFIEMLGGRIWLESELGKGSIFKFTLPYKPVNEVSDYKKSKKKTFDFSGKTILIAEDQDTNYLYISEIIAETGASILKATNGQEAVDLYLENPAIDIILMDIKMPIINGIEATKMIRGFNRDLPIIALTAYAMSGDKEKCMEAGCNAYISKPIIKDDLLSVIDRYIRK